MSIAHALVRWRFVAAVALVSCTGRDTSACTTCVADSGADASQRERDAGATLDARGEVGIDGGARAIDWVALPQLPDGCAIERARNPEDIPPMPWEACGPGCQRLAAGGRYFPTAGFYRDAAGWLVFISDELGGTGSQVMALAPVDGAPVAAWRYRSPTGATPYCRVRQIDLSDSGWVGMDVHFSGDPDLHVVEARFYAAPVASIGGTEVPIAVLGRPYLGDGAHVEDIAAGEGIVAARIGGRIVVAHDGRVDDAFVPAPTAEAYYPVTHDDRLVFAETITEWRLHDWTAGAGSAVLYDPADEVGQPQIDGDTLTWIQYEDFVDGFATRAELWRADLTSDRVLVSSRVHPDVEPNDAELADGIYGWYAPDELHLVDLASGDERTLPMSPGMECEPAWLHYVSQSEVLLGFCTVEGERTIYAYRLDPNVVAM